MDDTIRALSENGVRDKVKAIVGGASVSAEFGESIRVDSCGADGF
jgi:methanogenic corrinoid protein MtbC1